MRRQRGRGTFGGSSGVWWRKPNRVSIESAKALAETSTTTTPSPIGKDDVTDNSFAWSDLEESPARTNPMFQTEGATEQNDRESTTPSCGPPILVQAMSSSSSSLHTDYQTESLDVNAMEEEFMEVQGNAKIEALLWDDISLSREQASYDNHDRGAKEADELDQTDKLENMDPNQAENQDPLQSPLWNRPKHKRQFGGKLRRLQQPSNDPVQPDPITVPPQSHVLVAAHKVVANKKKRKRANNKLDDRLQSPRTQKEIQYYRSRFEQVDRNVKLNLECVQARPKRQCRQFKQLKLP